ncbi:MAG: sterol desaturase family protein [Gammaproteobacteria bacterium]|nr:sterol desaturase family protein [Gammaproteobacteria bacterium]
MALWEVLAPRRAPSVAKRFRWTSNLALVFLNTLLLRVLFPTAAVGLALQVAQHDWGLLNRFNLPEILRVLVGVVTLDLAIYLQHVMFHAVPALWRLHRMHHADLDFDVTTGARFHPIELILSMLIKFSAIAALGPPAIAVLIFEVLLNATAMFNHSNVRMPLALDRVLRWFIVTPDMHRVHHSIEPNETNSNFGFNLSLWDRLLGTYKSQPAAGHAAMTIGIAGYRDPHQVNRLDGMLLLPFVGAVTDYVINRRHGRSATKGSA